MAPRWLRPSRLPIEIKGLPLPWTILGLITTSFIAALIATRFAGLDGPWLWNFDTPTIYYPLAKYFHEALSQGSLPFWNDRIWMGTPLYAGGQIGAFYPPNWLIHQLQPLVALEVSRVLHLTFAGVGAGLIVLRMSGSRLGMLTTAIVAILSGAVVAKLDWMDMVTVYGWMPWVFLPLLWSRNGIGWGAVALAGILWGIQALCGHPPFWVLTGIAAGSIILARSPHLWSRRPNFRGLGKLAGFALVGVGVGAVQIVPSLVMLSLASRGIGFTAAGISEFSFRPFDLLGLAFANLFVPAEGPAFDLSRTWYPGGFWGFLESYAYVGLPILALAAIGLQGRRSRPILVVAIVAILVPILGVLLPSLWASIPVINGLRHPVRAYVILDLALAIGAGLGLARLGRGRDIRPSIVIVGVAIAGYAVVAAWAVGAPETFASFIALIWPTGTDASAVGVLARDSLTRAWPLALEILVGLTALALIRVRHREVSVRLAYLALIALPLALLLPPVNQMADDSAFTTEGSSLALAVQAQAPRQVLTINEPYFPGLMPALKSPASGRDPHVYSLEFFTALNLRATDQLLAVLYSTPDSPTTRAVGIDTIVSLRGVACPGRLVATDLATRATICRLDDAARPPYWLSPSAVIVRTGTGGGPLSPTEADVEPVEALKSAVPAAVSKWDNGEAVMTVDAPAGGYVFIDRAWWPGWQVSVDGVATTPFRAWGGQLVRVPAGVHQVEQRFFAWDAALGLVISIVTLLMIVALAGLARWRGSRRIDQSA